MGGFIYRGKSTNNVIGTPLMTASFDGVSNVVGTETEQIAGETTITRFIPNEYGVKKNGMEITFGLIKQNGEVFTDAEQIAVERWLTSPKYSSELFTFDTCTNELIASYCGLFTHTEWIPGGDGWFGVTFTFRNNHPYARKYYVHSLSILKEGDTYPSYIDMIEEPGQDTLYLRTVSVDCHSDELDEFVYPILTITAKEENIKLKIVNHTDEDNELNIEPLQNLVTIMDCNRCILKNSTTNEIVNFADVGLQDVGNIYWLRLFPEDNELKVYTTGEVEIRLEFYSVDKNAGGWT